MNVKCPNCRFKFDVDAVVGDDNQVTCVCPRCGNKFAVEPAPGPLGKHDDVAQSSKSPHPTQQSEPEVKYVYVERDDNKKNQTTWIIAGLIAALFIVGVAGWLWHDKEVTRRTELELQMANQSASSTSTSESSGSSSSTESTISNEPSTSTTDESSQPMSSGQSTPSVQETAVPAPQHYGRISDPDGYTNIRRGPGTSYPIVGKVNSGDNIYYTSQSNGWSMVYSGSQADTFLGYIHTSRIKDNTSGNSSASSGNYHEGYILDPVDSYVNVRKGPGTSYAIVGQLDNYTSVYYTTAGSKWYKVYDSNYNYIGYVFHDRIKKSI